MGSLDVALIETSLVQVLLGMMRVIRPHNLKLAKDD